MSEEKKPLSPEELAEILEAIAKAYEQAGRKITTATLIDDVKEDGTVSGEILIDNREDKDKN